MSSSATMFEALMLVCFGIAWPFSVYHLIKTKKSHGKSVPFLVVVIIGYVFGILFEFSGGRNYVLYLYLLNMSVVSVDLALTLKYRRAERAGGGG